MQWLTRIRARGCEWEDFESEAGAVPNTFTTVMGRLSVAHFKLCLVTGAPEALLCRESCCVPVTCTSAQTVIVSKDTRNLSFL